MTDLENVWRGAAPQVVSALIRRYGDFDQAEDATQEALLAAAQQWPGEGIPSDPTAWLIRVASRRLIDAWRSDAARREREGRRSDSGAEAAEPASAEDDSLTLILLCCHPALTRTAQVPLTLRAVGGLTTAQIGRVLLTSESTVAQRISRAKSRLREVDARFEQPDDVSARMSAVLQVLYLVFTEGYAPSGSTDTVGAMSEAIRLTRMLRELRPEDGEVAGLLALMLFTRARQSAQTAPGLVPLAEQDRSQWDGTAIEEGVAVLEVTLPRGPAGPYALQAAIAAVHAEATTWEATDWPQIVALYDLLAQAAPSPVVALNRAVAVAMVDGPEAGLREVDLVAGDRALRHSHRSDAVRAHLLEMSGELDAARKAYQSAADRTTSGAERAYLLRRVAEHD